MCAARTMPSVAYALNQISGMGRERIFPNLDDSVYQTHFLGRRFPILDAVITQAYCGNALEFQGVSA